MNNNNLDSKSNISDIKIAIVRAKFNPEISEQLLESCQKGLLDSGIQDDNVRVFEVPGSFEITLAAKKLALSGEFDAIICIGAILKHHTLDYDYVAQAVTAGIIQLNLEVEIPILFGIVTALDSQEANKQCQPDNTNLGYRTALACVDMIKVCEAIDEISL